MGAPKSHLKTFFYPYPYHPHFIQILQIINCALGNLLHTYLTSCWCSAAHCDHSSAPAQRGCRIIQLLAHPSRHGTGITKPHQTTVTFPIPTLIRHPLCAGAEEWSQCAAEHQQLVRRVQKIAQSTINNFQDLNKMRVIRVKG